MRQINKKLIKFSIFAIIGSIVFSLGAYIGVEAYSGTVYGRKQGYGYFKNVYQKGSSGSGGYVIKNGVKNVNSVSKLMSFLKSKNKSSGQDEAGSAFIVYTLLGKNGKDRDKDISNGDWDDLEARLRSLDSRGNINWSKNVSLSINSYHQEYKNSKGKTVHDDAFYSNSSNEKSIVFTDDKGKIIYALAHKCANPMGNKGSFAGIPEANEWSVSTKSTVKTANYTPGQVITWNHSVKNDGPDDTDTDVSYRYENRSGLGSGNGSNHTFDSGANKNDDEDFDSTHTITQNDVGNNLCRVTSATPEAWDDDGRTTSSAACVAIPYNYSLTPFVSANVSGTVEANTTFSLTPSVTNTGPTKSRNTQWQITQIVVEPGSAIPNQSGGNSSSAPCGTYFSGAGANCSTVSSGNTVFSETGSWLSGSMISATAVTAGDYEVGTHICYAFSVQPRSSSSNDWSHSATVCLVIGKKPKVQVHGSDLSVGGIVQGSTAVKNISGVNRTFGSWVEYGIFASGSITGVAAGSAYAGSGLANASLCMYSRLSFTNAGSSLCTNTTPIGGYNVSRNMPDVASSFPANTTNPDRNLGSGVTVDLTQNNLQGIYTASGTLTINGGGSGDHINKGQWIVINAPTTDITIGGDIHYTDETLSTIDEIPQVVIIARNININDSVRNVDAWLIASGSINTCSSVGTSLPLSANICNRMLTVNGPVMADKLYLRRTAGSGTGSNSGDPAEVFNLRPDVYLWSLARANESGQIHTVKTIELPPRF